MIFYRALRGILKRFEVFVSTRYTKFIFSIYKVKYGDTLTIRGLPIIDLQQSSYLEIGSNLTMNSGNNFNRIGRQQKCLLLVGKNGTLKIGDNVGMSSSSIVCYYQITIADNVLIGGNTVIYDTDFHSLDYTDRFDKSADQTNAVSKPVIIGKNVFIGAHTTILKGVEIGDNSIVAACSVVTKSIGENEVWGGNPAQLLRRLK